MKLREYIIESLILESYNIGAEFIDSTMCINYWQEKCKKRESGEVPVECIKYLYDVWQKEKSSDVKFIPFRFSPTGNIKLSHAYELTNIMDEIAKIAKNNNYTFRGTRTGFSLNGYTITWGEGSLGVDRSKKGLDYEAVIIDQVIQLIELLSGKSFDEKILSEDESLMQLKRLLPLKNVLNDVVEMVKNGTSIDELRKKYVLPTGKQDVSRNKQHQLWDENFNITGNDIEKVLFDSGKIISDVTVNDNIFLSVKLKEAQLSGVTYYKAMANNLFFQEQVSIGTSFEEIDEKKEMIPFKNVFKTFGLDPEDVYNKYLDLNQNGKITDLNLKIVDNDPEKLGILVQKLIGGNYWYVNPKYCFYVPYKVTTPKLTINEASISPEGKTITLKGKIKSFNFKLVYRTDGKGPYPYRIFPQLDVKNYIESL